MKVADKFLQFFDMPHITRARAFAGAFHDAAQAIQAQTEQQMNTTATVFLAQRPAVDREAERKAYGATHDKLHAEALAIMRQREGK